MLRNTDFMNAKNMQTKIEQEIKTSKIDAIIIEVEKERNKRL